jgi:SOS-response transcriptional repressor LexA
MSIRELRRAPRDLGYRGVQVLAFIQTTIESEGAAPSYRMIAEELGLVSKGDVNKIVRRLESRGLLSRAGAGRVRRLRLHNGDLPAAALEL